MPGRGLGGTPREKGMAWRDTPFDPSTTLPEETDDGHDQCSSLVPPPRELELDLETVAVRET